MHMTDVGDGGHAKASLRVPQWLAFSFKNLQYIHRYIYNIQICNIYLYRYELQHDLPELLVLVESEHWQR